jgi:hypothetical protein
VIFGHKVASYRAPFLEVEMASFRLQGQLEACYRLGMATGRIGLSCDSQIIVYGFLPVNGERGVVLVKLHYFRSRGVRPSSCMVIHAKFR